MPLYQTIKTIQIQLLKFYTTIFCLPSTTQSSSVGRWPNNPRWGCCCYYFSISASAVAVRSLILLLLLLLSQSLHFDTHINILLWTPRQSDLGRPTARRIPSSTEDAPGLLAAVLAGAHRPYISGHSYIWLACQRQISRICVIFFLLKAELANQALFHIFSTILQRNL